MRIATKDKIDNPISSVFGRARTGAKGIGRFAARRLASKMTLSSVAERDNGTRESVSAEFDWDTDFTPGRTLTEIPVAYERHVVPDTEPTGVTLLLDKTRDVWGDEEIAELQRDLLSLINPFNERISRASRRKGRYKRDPGFSIRFEAPEFPQYEGELKDQFLAASWAVLKGRVGETGQARYELNIRKPAELLHFTVKDEEFENLAGARFTIYYFVYRKEYFEGLEFGVRDAQLVAREQAGVRIYLDGFRVFPYGDPGDDWLRLNEIRARRTVPPALPAPLQKELSVSEDRPLLLTPGTNQLFGAVSLSQSHHLNGQNEAIELNISRERLVENLAFGQLSRFVQLGIFWMTIQYARVTYSERKRKPRSRPVEELLEDIVATVDSTPELPSRRKAEISQAVSMAREVIRQQEEERISELSMLRILASAGLMVNLLNHQIRTILSKLGAIATLFSQYSDMIPQKSRASYEETVRELRVWHRFAEQQVKQLGFMLGREARSKRRELNLHEIVDQVNGALEAYRTKFGIELENGVPNNIFTPKMHEAEIHAILINLLTNSLKAVREQPTRKIRIEAQRHENHTVIRMLDTGRGIEPRRREEVFEPFVTTSSPDPILGIGTGLGLPTVRSLLETYDGEVHFIDPPSGWKTCVEVSLPLR